MLFDDSRTADFVFVAQGREVFVHRAVLLEHSAFLRSFLAKDPTCTRINANNALYDSMKIVLRSMYEPLPPNIFGDLQYNYAVVLSAFEIALHFTITNTAAAVAPQLMHLVDRRNVLRSVKACLKHPQSEVARGVLKFCATHLPPEIDTEEAAAEWRVVLHKHPHIINAPRDASGRPSGSPDAPADASSAGAGGVEAIRRRYMEYFEQYTRRSQSTPRAWQDSTHDDQSGDAPREVSVGRGIREVQDRLGAFSARYGVEMAAVDDYHSSRGGAASTSSSGHRGTSGGLQPQAIAPPPPPPPPSSPSPSRATRAAERRLEELHGALAEAKRRYQSELRRFRDRESALMAEVSGAGTTDDGDVSVREARYALERARDRLEAAERRHAKLLSARRSMTDDIAANERFCRDALHRAPSTAAASEEMAAETDRCGRALRRDAGVGGSADELRRWIQQFGMRLRDECEQAEQQLLQQEQSRAVLRRRIADERQRMAALQSTWRELLD